MQVIKLRSHFDTLRNINVGNIKKFRKYHREKISETMKKVETSSANIKTLKINLIKLTY
jgi:hypothetical protein